MVHSSLKPRCIACNNCVLACPFGIPKMMEPEQQMMKCDMCYDRTSEGKRPMCATVCPARRSPTSVRKRLPNDGRSQLHFLFWRTENYHQGVHDGAGRTGRHRLGRSGLYVAGTA